MRNPLSMVLFCSDGPTKQRFKESFQAGKFDVQIHLAQHPKEIDERIKKRLEVDFVLVATHSYESRVELVSIVSKNMAAGAPPPVFVVVKELERDGVKLSNLLAAGADGVVAEPLRVEAVEQVVEHMLESSKYKDFREHKARAILAVTLTNACLLVDQLARIKINEGVIPTEILRERPRMQSSIAGFWDTCKPEDYVSALLYVCNQREPFAPRIDSRRERRQKRALHPAKIVSRIMMVRGITVDRLAAAMRVDIETLKQFLGEQLEMNEELAENLSRVLGHDKNYWLELCPGRGVVQEKSA